MAETMQRAKRIERVAKPEKPATARSDEKKESLKLLSRSDTYILKSDRATVRRETPMPGTSSSGVAAKKLPRGPSRLETDGEPTRFGVLSRDSGARSKAEVVHRKNFSGSSAKSQLTAAATKLAKSTERKDPAKTKKAETLRLIVAFSALLAIVAGFCVWLPDATRVTKVSVNGMVTVSEKDIVAAMGLSRRTNLLTADIKGMETRILAIPSIASAKITRALPDALVATVQERKAVARVFVPVETGMRAVFIDAQGVAFAWDDGQSMVGELPVLSGIRFDNFSPGQKLPDFLQPVLRDMSRIELANPALLRAFSEIKIVKISENEAELLLYPISPSIPVRMAPHLTEANLGSVLLVLDVLSSRPDVGKIQEVDFRTGTITYKVKEAQAG